MKNQTYITLLLSLSVSQCFMTFGQTRLGKTLPDSTIFSITSRSGILYCGIDNVLQADLNKIQNSDSIILTTNNGILFNEKKPVVIPEHPGTLRIIASTSGNQENELGYANFIVQNAPEPVLMIDTLKITDNVLLPRESLLSAEKLSVWLSDDIVDSDKWYTIREFTIGYTYGGYKMSQNIKGSHLDEESKNLILSALPDRYVLIIAIVESNTGVIKTWPIARKIYLY